MKSNPQFESHLHNLGNNKILQSATNLTDRLIHTKLENQNPTKMADEKLGKSTTATTTILHHHHPRRKVMGTAGTRVWLVVSESGQSHLEEVGKHSIMRRTGLPARDLRVLDPVLSYPSTILGRERAIVVNLEHIKAIITAREILMVNSTNPLVVAFVGNLQKRVSGFNWPPPQQVILHRHIYLTIFQFDD